MNRRLSRTAVSYLAGIVGGVGIAIVAHVTGARDNIYVMVAVLLVVAAALLGGTGPAVAVAITAVIGDDVVLSGRLPPLDQWKDELVFGTIAVTVGLLVAAKRRQQLKAEQLAVKERDLRTERDSILAAISHDVKNPLAVILGSAQRGMHGVTADADRVFRRIEAAALQASHLIDQLADLHSLDVDRIDFSLRYNDLRKTTAAAIDQMEALARGHALKYAAPPTPVFVRYDDARIQRVLHNLVGNAIKYSPDGGDVEIAMRVDGEEVIVSIRDHGIGIPEEERTRVFNRGYRAQGVGAIPGTGLGLFISAEIVRGHGGTITCAAAHGGGTTFDIRLPLARVRLAAEPLEELPGDWSGSAGTDGPIVDGDNGHRLAGGAREKRLVRAE